MSTYYYIYKTTNTINNKIYVGSHSSNTLNFDGYFGSGQNIISALKKYGEKAFTREILEVICLSTKKLSIQDWGKFVLPVETKWIKHFNDTDSVMYNINTDSAFGGNTTSGTIWVHNPENLKHKMVHNDSIPCGWVRGRKNINNARSIGRKLYTNMITGEERGFYTIPNQDWVLGSIKQTKIRKGEANPSHGKKWYQNKLEKTYCYTAEGCPENFESGHPDWKYDKNWKSAGWLMV
jgi:group I intron endonuclease